MTEYHKLRPEGFIPLVEAAEMSKISYAKLRRLIEEGKLSTYRAESDRRSKWIKLSELEDLMTPKLIERV